MWFLLLQIFFLLLLAALIGAALGHWWTRRRYEDVTEIHEELMAVRAGKSSQYATREDVKLGIADVSAAVASIQAPDLEPLRERIAGLEEMVGAIRIPEPDLNPLQQHLSSLQQHLTGQQQRLSALEQQLGGVSTAVSRLSNADLAPVEQRLAGVEQMVREWKAPEVDLGPVHSGIVTLQLAIDRMKTGEEAGAVHDQLTRLENQLTQFGENLDAAHKQDIDALAMRVSALRIPDVAPHIMAIEAKLTALERTISSIRVPEPDLTQVQVALAHIDGALRSLDAKPPVDLEPVQRRFTGLEAGLGMLQTEAQARRALEPVERRLAGLEEALAGRHEPDMQVVMNALHAIDSRQDLVSIEHRMTAIEYSLAAIHHAMRARPETRLVREAAPVEAWPGRPPRENDPINALRRPDDQANLLTGAAFGPADDLKAIHGVGPMLAGLLNEIGVFYFWQVAEWTPEEAAWVDTQLMHFRGRIRRDDWIGHARQLSQQAGAAKRPTRGL